MVYSRVFVCGVATVAVEHPILFCREGAVGEVSTTCVVVTVGIAATFSVTESVFVAMVVAAGPAGAGCDVLLPVGAAFIPAGIEWRLTGGVIGDVDGDAVAVRLLAMVLLWFAVLLLMLLLLLLLLQWSLLSLLLFMLMLLLLLCCCSFSRLLRTRGSSSLVLVFMAVSV